MNQLPTAAIVVDMGGTTTRIGVYHQEQLLPGTIRFATPKPAPGRSVREQHLDLIATETDRLRSRAGLDLREVGVAAGATVDASGRVRNATMLWGETSADVDLRAALEARLPWADVVVCNDIAAATWRYQHLGRFALVTVSTGIAVKIFDDALPFAAKLILDEDGLGGEIGHVRIDATAPGPPLPGTGDDGDGAPWCECGNIGDLCSYASGPAAARAAARYARAAPARWRGSALYSLCDGQIDRIATRPLAAAARVGDDFAMEVLHAATRPLAAVILQLSAQLGLRRFVVMGGFAHGVGAPWFSALRSGLGDLLPGGGWFTGWTGTDLDALVSPSAGDDNDTLLGMGTFLAARRMQAGELYKPVGENRTVVRYRSRPRCGREQFAARIMFAGICGTDLQILRGERGCEPGVLGHECVAQVTEAGADAGGLHPGQVFAVNPNHPNDEHDKLGHNQPGVLREIAVWDRHMADRGQLIHLPEDSSAECVLLEPLACAVRSLRVGRDEWKGRRVLVVGAGVSGLLHVILARQGQAGQVLLANRGTQRLHTAVARGLLPAEDCLPLGTGLAASLEHATEGAGLDSVFVSVSGSTGPSVVASLWPCLSDGATVHLFGGFPPDAVIRTPGGDLVAAQPIRSRGEARQVSLPDGRSCTLVGSRGAGAEDFQRAADACLTMDAEEPRLASLVSHVVSLDATPAVLAELAADGCVDGAPALRVVVDLRLRGQVVRRADPAQLPRLGEA
jgi:threonine dehydrogenase-like Zn-dependent dehydrogenase/predicted NBD/HSP70 family sugar kinase